MDNPTPEEISRHYSALLESVHLINALVPTQDAENLNILARNVRHLEIMLERDWWAGYDLSVINAAIMVGKQ